MGGLGIVNRVHHASTMCAKLFVSGKFGLELGNNGPRNGCTEQVVFCKRRMEKNECIKQVAMPKRVLAKARSKNRCFDC